MTSPISNNLWNVLACSYCGQPVAKTDAGAECSSCGSGYQFTQSGSLNMRLNRPKQYTLQFELGSVPIPQDERQFGPLVMNAEPEVNVSHIRVPWHLSRGMMSYFPKASAHGSLMLDLGCGDAIHKRVCELAGFEWVGLDYASPRAPILGDAHSLPFRSDTFEFISTVAVLEHIRFPFVMMRETYRVLKPGGRPLEVLRFLSHFMETVSTTTPILGLLTRFNVGGSRQCESRQAQSGPCSERKRGWGCFRECRHSWQSFWSPLFNWLVRCGGGQGVC